jgi:Ca2+-dependent lipid-binding protein
MTHVRGSGSHRLPQFLLPPSQLKNVAGAFKGTSDPYAVVTLLANDPSEKPTVLGKTEVIKNSLNPKWTASFDLPYHLGCPTRINVGIYDEVRKGTHKPMGSAAFEVGEVLGARGNIKAKNLRNGGTLYARITPAPDAGAPGS